MRKAICVISVLVLLFVSFTGCAGVASDQSEGVIESCVDLETARYRFCEVEWDTQLADVEAQLGVDLNEEAITYTDIASPTVAYGVALPFRELDLEANVELWFYDGRFFRSVILIRPQDESAFRDVVYSLSEQLKSTGLGDNETYFYGINPDRFSKASIEAYLTQSQPYADEMGGMSGDADGNKLYINAKSRQDGFTVRIDVEYDLGDQIQR